MILFYLFTILSMFFNVFCFINERKSFTYYLFDESGLMLPISNRLLVNPTWVLLNEIDNDNHQKKLLYWLKLNNNCTNNFAVLMKRGRDIHSNTSQTQPVTCIFCAASHLIESPHLTSMKYLLDKHHMEEEIRFISQKFTQSPLAEYLRVSLCDGISGVVKLDNSSSYVLIHSVKSSQPSNIVIIELLSSQFKQDNIYKENTLEKNLFDMAGRRASNRLKRKKRATFQIPENKIPTPYLVELYIIVDSKIEIRSRNSQYRSLMHRIVFIINQINMAFSQFNIYFTVVQLEIWEDDPINLYDENHIIMELQLYKRRFITKRHDCLHAILGVKIGTAKRGEAQLASMCGYNYCVAFSKDYEGQNELELSLSVVHEIGHNFGLRHDTDECNCIGCIMATGIEYINPNFKWSICSKRQMASLLKSGIADCLRDRPVEDLANLYPMLIKRFHETKPLKDVDTSKCGNGVIDSGEQCDCGLSSNCPCCDSKSCLFVNRANCAQGACCDLTTCLLQKPSFVCRPSVGDPCDLPEFCSGSSEWCPADVYKKDGSECVTRLTREVSYCYQRQCDTRQSRCKDLWGDSGQEADKECYEMNMDGDKMKNCGLEIPKRVERDRQTRNWNGKSCTSINSMCGRLWCTQESERVLRISPKLILDETYNDHDCSAVRFDMNWFFDEAGMVPNGATCGGAGNMCWKAECIPTSSLKSDFCYCNGHGVCNNKDHCHCNPGFAPPYCNISGNGGSIDSGPPSEFSNIRTIISSIMILLIIILTVIIVATLIYHFRNGRWPPIFACIKCPPFITKLKAEEKVIPPVITHKKPKYPLVVKVDTNYSNHKSLLHSPKSPDNLNNSFVRKFPIVDKGKFLDNIKNNALQRTQNPKLLPKPNGKITLDNASIGDSYKPEILVPKPDKRSDKERSDKERSDKERSDKEISDKEKPPNITMAKPIKTVIDRDKSIGKIEKPLLGKKPEKSLVQIPEVTKTDNVNSRPPMVMEKPNKAIVETKEKAGIQSDSKDKQRPAILSNKPEKQLSNNYGPPLKQGKPLLETKDAHLSLGKIINQNRNMQKSQFSDKLANRMLLEQESSNDASKDIRIPSNYVTKTPMSPLKNTKYSNTRDNITKTHLDTATKPLEVHKDKQQIVKYPRRNEESNTQDNIKKTKLDNTTKPVNIHKDKPEGHERIIKDTQRKNISHPQLVQTTCTDPTMDLPTTDKTLTRIVAPHKILKCDPKNL